MATSRAPTRPCAACAHMQRACTEACLLAPYFPADQPHLFAPARALLGIPKMEEMLAAVHPLDRPHLARGIIYETTQRAKNPMLRGLPDIPGGILDALRFIALHETQRDLAPEMNRTMQLLAARQAADALPPGHEKEERLAAVRQAARDLQQEIKLSVRPLVADLAETIVQNGIPHIVFEDESVGQMGGEGESSEPKVG